ncbi:LAME_0G14378g1_1 [Lachancea meyersii CBS 8951]|uniref:Biogenesis of lysosome-related organelles complex 1 subunit BLI1 n=1 Tax=Lachancea meyersii CBS 8951 TaxID=1266667 RepID=A0A1G4KAF1_9SACH|nr:LAME_0G14378g1_1 [Lachancea meyersii CBS 8951]
MKETQLRKYVEHCSNKLQEIVDLQSAQAIKDFQAKTEDNYHRLDELKDRFKTNEQIIEEFRALKCEFGTKIHSLEQSVIYYEKLADELQEFLVESQVKKKLALKRQSQHTAK